MASPLPVLRPPLAAPDCRTYPCHEECCLLGADVYPHERERMLRDGIAAEDEFTGPYDDNEDREVLFRTGLGTRGCVFLMPTRGCRLHVAGYKPAVCRLAPRDVAEADEMQGDGLLPCRASWSYER